MKKWHMESIINNPETANNKLAIPQSPQINYWSNISLQEAQKEFPFKQICRSIVGFFLKFL